MVRTTNGFEIAELDLQQRGPGEFFGTRQAGLPDFRVANLLRMRHWSLDLKKEHDRVMKLAVTDDVSGFHNTRYLHRYLDRLIETAAAKPVEMMNHRLRMLGRPQLARQGSALDMPFADQSFGR